MGKWLGGWWEEGGRVVGKRTGVWNGGWWEDGGRVVGRWIGGCWEIDGMVVGGCWEGGWRIVGGVVVAVGLLSMCHGDLRDRLVFPQRIQVSFRVVRGPSGFLSSHCPRIGSCLEFSRETQCSSPVETGISGFLSRFN